MGSIRNSNAKTAKDLAKKVAKQVAREPLEMGKVAKDTITGSEKPTPQATPSAQTTQELPVSELEKEQMESKRRRIMQALETELADIRNQKKTAQDEAKRQEALARQKQEEAVEAQAETFEVSSKPGRKFMVGVKSHLSRLKKSTETRLPPTG